MTLAKSILEVDGSIRSRGIDLVARSERVHWNVNPAIEPRAGDKVRARMPWRFGSFLVRAFAKPWLFGRGRPRRPGSGTKVNHNQLKTTTRPPPTTPDS